MAVQIIVDSTADVMPEIKERLKVVPLTVHFGETEYIDGVTINYKEFYEKLVESDVLPTTSQPNPAAFEQAYKEVVETGDTAVVLTVASKLSGTYQSAMIAAEDYEDKIYIVDTKTVAIASGILAEYALNLVESGMDAKSIAEKLEEEKEKVCLVAMVDTLEYLYKGGRLSKTSAIVGGMLSIKPVLTVKDGEIVVLGKARGSKQGNNLLVTEIKKAGGVDFDKPLLLGYTGLTDVLLQKYITDSERLWKDGTEELRYTPIGSAIGTHAGPGAVAVAFFKK